MLSIWRAVKVSLPQAGHCHSYSVTAMLWSRLWLREMCQRIVGDSRMGCTALTLCVACIGASSWGAATVLCHPLATPEYLIPYYLRSIKSRFRHYASVRSADDGAMLMTMEDFVRSVLVLRKDEPLGASSLEDMSDLFASLDADGNVCLNLTEYTFLMVLLTAKLKDIRMLFTIVDKDRVGTLGLSEFAGVLRGLGCTANEANSLTTGCKNGIVRRLFGDDGELRCSYDEMEGSINAINEAIWRAEFHLFDPNNVGCIGAEEFGKLLAKQMIGSNVPFYVVENIRRMRGINTTVTVDQWIGFHQVMREADTIGEAVRLFMESGLSLGKREFNRVVKAAGVRPFKEEELDLIMALFDRNGDGALDFDEFISLMKRKLSYQYSGSTANEPREVKHFPTRLVECVGETLRGSVG
ncbi:mitochondrial calcium uptake 1 [Trypanosoma brucei equiperdum]|uniref:Mitochondrial calcium uptake 1 n=1 Tax=Trypanosoma brucei equiperdum TaxID=630700 RepID=A0A3L6L257_9TRYP|nr:mitochondrial calcium uptake 1 [Trypanosoma brucei equiperdum]